MKRTVLSISLLFFWFNQINAQWFSLNSPTSAYLFSTYFVNYDTGYAVGGDINSSVFLKSVNGGLDWNVITNTQTKWLYDVLFLDDTTGLACGYDGAMYKTTDAGETWNAKPSQTTGWLYAIDNKPDGTVFAIGTDGTLIKSVNRGDNWNTIVSNTAQTMLDIQFYDNSYGVAVGYAGEMIYTTDGGNNWAVKLMGTPVSMTGVYMLSPDTIWVCGLQGQMYKTNNAGQNFSFSTPGPNDLNAIFFTDDLNGYLTGSQANFQTTDGGVIWTPMNNPTANSMKDIFVSADNRVMYAVGSSGSIIKNINTIGIENQPETMIAIYPNPSDGIICISLPGNYEINVLDLKGNLIKQKIFEEIDKGQIDLSDFVNGEYILQVLQDGKTSFGRIVIKH